MRKPPRRIPAVLIALVAGPLVALLVVAAAAIQGEPAVVLQSDLAPEDMARALALARSHDPRHATPGAVRAVRLSERDVDLLLNHAAHRWLDGKTQLSLEQGAATLRSSVHLPANPFGRWLNVEMRLVQTGALPVLDTLHVGRLPLPAWLGHRVALAAARRAGYASELTLAQDVLRSVSFEPEQIAVVYAWTGDSVERVASVLVPLSDQARMRAYSELLARLVGREEAGWHLPLAPMIGPLFKLARERSADGDAAAENRAALLVLTLLASGRSIETLVPSARDWARPRPVQLLLGGRDDFPRHLLVSAALAVEGTGPLSKAIGLYKEVVDSRSGSGFSFNDMAANRAGTRLGELAVAQPERLQAALAGSVAESDIMPSWTDLPEFMPEAEFKRRFGGVDEPAYAAMMAEIDRRVAALPVLR